MVLLGYFCAKQLWLGGVPGTHVSTYSTSDLPTETCSKEIKDVSVLTCNETCYQGSADGLTEGTNIVKGSVTQTEKQKKCFSFYLTLPL